MFDPTLGTFHHDRFLPLIQAASDPASDAKAHVEGQQDASDSVQSLKKAISDVSSKARAVQNDDNLIKGFTEIGDANVEPDDDY